MNIDNHHSNNMRKNIIPIVICIFFLYAAIFMIDMFSISSNGVDSIEDVRKLYKHLSSSNTTQEKEKADEITNMLRRAAEPYFPMYATLAYDFVLVDGPNKASVDANPKATYFAVFETKSGKEIFIKILCSRSAGWAIYNHYHLPEEYPLPVLKVHYVASDGHLWFIEANR